MNRFFLFSTCFFLISILTEAQVPKKRFPQNINVPTYSHVFPSLSGDGNQMIYLTDYTNSEGFETKYTYRTGRETWADPEPIPSINRPGLDHIGSFCLSYDGNFVVFSSRRIPTIGNYDIWISEKIGNYWSQPKNPGKPLNSPAHEGNPSLSPDGKSIYFMRCGSMDVTSKSNCGIFVSHRLSATRWSEPEELPPHINSGHEVTPRIMADNKTLIFGSGRPGGLGKLDLYSSTLENERWSGVKALSFINTDQNDEFIAVPARGDIIYFSSTYRNEYNLYMAMIPDEFRPQKVLMLTGSVTYNDGLKPSDDVIVQAFDTKTGEVFTTARLRQNDGSFTLFLPEGTAYDVSAFPQKGGHSYQSRIIDLSTMNISRKEEFNMDLKSLHSGLTIPLTTIRYENYSSDLLQSSDIEIKRIIGFMKKNPRKKIEIGAFIDTVYTDSISSYDLTEVIIDTTFVEVPIAESAEEKELISSNFEVQDSIKISELSANEDSINFNSNSSLDSFAILSPSDSLVALGYELFSEDENHQTFMMIKYTYHNDRTQKQAEALMNKLIASGVPPNLLEANGYGDRWSEDRAEEERNYWIELKIMDQ